MTSLVNAVAMFCEDIRDEVSGQHSIIGVFSDNLKVSTIPGVMPKLGVYVRIHLDVACEPSELMIILLDAENNLIGDNIFTAELVARTLEDAKKTNKKVAGFFSQMVAGQMPIKQAGPIECHLRFNNETRFLGSLNLVLDQAESQEA